jgi:hypothetical protein
MNEPTITEPDRIDTPPASVTRFLRVCQGLTPEEVELVWPCLPAALRWRVADAS